MATRLVCCPMYPAARQGLSLSHFYFPSLLRLCPAVLFAELVEIYSLKQQVRIVFGPGRQVPKSHSIVVLFLLVVISSLRQSLRLS